MDSFRLGFGLYDPGNPYSVFFIDRVMVQVVDECGQLFFGDFGDSNAFRAQSFAGYRLIPHFLVEHMGKDERRTAMAQAGMCSSRASMVDDTVHFGKDPFVGHRVGEVDQFGIVFNRFNKSTRCRIDDGWYLVMLQGAYEAGGNFCGMVR